MVKIVVNYCAPAILAFAVASPALAIETTDSLIAAVVAPYRLVTYQVCRDNLRSESMSQGINGEIFDEVMNNVGPDITVIDKMSRQPELRLPIWDYLAFMVDSQRVEDGKKALAENEAIFESAEKKLGVDRYILAAIWGVETDYGRNLGTSSLPQSLSTLACLDNSRRQLFEDEFISSLRIIAENHIPPSMLKGSWAGAFGHTQFMPSTYLNYAVSYKGTYSNLSELPDAIYSTSNYLAKSGWKSDSRPLIEIALPQNYSGPKDNKPRTIAEWLSNGIEVLDKNDLPKDLSLNATLMAPADFGGPVFLALPNYRALARYNAAKSYIFAIAILADKLHDKSTPVYAWPTDDPGLSRTEVRELQKYLIDRGLYNGPIDGFAGMNTRKAIKTVEELMGMPVTGHAGTKILSALR